MSALNLSADQSLSIVERARASKQTGAHATIDFETRSNLSVMSVGAYRYALDPSTEILCLCYLIPGEEPGIWHPWLEETPDDLFDWIAAGGIVEAHNAEFEYCIWNYIGSRRHHWPQLSISQLRCSAAKAAALALPRALENLGLALNLPVKKDMQGRRLMLKMTRPRTRGRSKSVQVDADMSEKWNESFEEIERLIQYCATDVKTEELASERMVPLIPREQRTFELTQRMNERGIYCDVPLARKAVEFATRYKLELEEDLRKVTGGKVQTAKQNAKITAFLKDEGVETENLQAPTVAKLLATAPEGASAKAIRVLQIRQALAKSSITKYQSMLTVVCPDGRIRGTLLYHGASTGRYSGKLIQPQNFVKPKRGDDPALVHELLEFGDYEFFKTIFPDVFRALAAGLRGMLRAAPGKVLYSGDFNAIEARVILWLACDDENLREYYDGLDPYKTMGALIFGVKYEDVTKEQRELGKRAVLGCGFGMGPEKFFKTCAEQGFPIEMELAEKAVKAYRLKYKAVRNFWYDLERAAIQAVKRPGTVQKIGRLQWLYRGGYLLCQLPSGRRIAYSTPSVVATPFRYKVKEFTVNPDGTAVLDKDGKPAFTVKIEETIKDQIRYWAVHPKTKKWTTERTYGGKLAENVTQAVARDVMVESMFRVESAGYMNIFTVHDEDVTEADEGHGSVEEFEEIMSKVPAWADGLPIRVEGWRDYRYKK